MRSIHRATSATSSQDMNMTHILRLIVDNRCAAKCSDRRISRSYGCSLNLCCLRMSIGVGRPAYCGHHPT